MKDLSRTTVVGLGGLGAGPGIEDYFKDEAGSLCATRRNQGDFLDSGDKPATRIRFTSDGNLISKWLKKK